MSSKAGRLLLWSSSRQRKSTTAPRVACSPVNENQLPVLAGADLIGPSLFALTSPQDATGAGPMFGKGRRDKARASLLPSPFLHDAALGLAARLLLASLDPSIAVTEVESADQVRLDLEDRRAALLRVIAVHGAAGVRGAVKLSEEDQGREHAHLRFVGGLDLDLAPRRALLSLSLRLMSSTTRSRSATIPSR